MRESSKKLSYTAPRLLIVLKSTLSTKILNFESNAVVDSELQQSLANHIRSETYMLFPEDFILRGGST